MFAPLPLLHTAQTAATVDVGVLACFIAFGIGLVAGAGAGALSGPGGPLRRPRARRRLAIFAVSALTFLAIAPAVVPYDHLWPQDVHGGDAVHASHCHEAPASCADAPVTSGPGQLINAAPLIVIPALLAILVIASTPVLVGVTRRPALPPPLVSVAAYA